MIRYSLTCSKGHVFEEWFDNMADYDTKAEKKKLLCPECGDKKVAKALMAPSIGAASQTPAPAPSCGVGGGGCGGCPMAGMHGQ
ncbi:MAG: DUF1178 family protein [Alphaproteobacteria bacterium]|jgi:hypothetical protein|nr:DUF1178 family protein [Alphaproteobacteria bacterium]